MIFVLMNSKKYLTVMQTSVFTFIDYSKMKICPKSFSAEILKIGTLA
jgi:hypothetical protein